MDKENIKVDLNPENIYKELRIKQMSYICISEMYYFIFSLKNVTCYFHIEPILSPVCVFCLFFFFCNVVTVIPSIQTVDVSIAYFKKHLWTFQSERCL